MNFITRVKQILNSITSYGAGYSTNFFGRILEPFAGAWQRNIELESPQNILAFSAVYACVSMISQDISKLRIKLVELDDNGIWNEVVRGSPFLPVLRKPNDFQTRIQFLAQWIVSKLLMGNAYIIKGRDNRGGENRGIVTELYVLDPRGVTPLVADNGDVYYRIKPDYLAKVTQEDYIVPASEIIHDRGMTPWHPLVGLSPIYACGASATQGIRIQANSELFFKNMSRPSGILSAPGTLDEVTLAKLKAQTEAMSSGQNIGRLIATGGGIVYHPMTMPAIEAQLIEQLGWTVADVGRAFHMPAYKLGLQQPTITSIGALNMEYYVQTLQNDIECIELLLDEGLGLPALGLGTELDLDGLLRMDPLSRAEAYQKLQGVAKVDELRLKENLPPTPGGDAVYLQQQNYSTSALAKRDAKADPFVAANTSSTPAVPALPAPKEAEVDVDALVNAAIEKAIAGLPAPEKVDYERIESMLSKPETEMEKAKQLADELVARFVEVTRV